MAVVLPIGIRIEHCVVTPFVAMWTELSPLDYVMVGLLLTLRRASAVLATARDQWSAKELSSRKATCATTPFGVSSRSRWIDRGSHLGQLYRRYARVGWIQAPHPLEWVTPKREDY